MRIEAKRIAVLATLVSSIGLTGCYGQANVGSFETGIDVKVSGLDFSVEATLLGNGFQLESASATPGHQYVELLGVKKIQGNGQNIADVKETDRLFMVGDY